MLIKLTITEFFKSTDKITVLAQHLVSKILYVQV